MLDAYVDTYKKRYAKWQMARHKAICENNRRKKAGKCLIALPDFQSFNVDEVYVNVNDFAHVKSKYRHAFSRMSKCSTK